jgi:hypothetical protein
LRPPRGGLSTEGATKRDEIDEERRTMTDVRAEIEGIADRETRAWDTMDVNLLQYSED